MSVYIEHKQISLLYIQINVKIPSRVERTPSTSPQHIAETEFRIHKTKPNTFNLRRYPTLTQSLRRSGTRIPPSACQPPREAESPPRIQLQECPPSATKPPKKPPRLDAFHFHANQSTTGRQPQGRKPSMNVLENLVPPSDSLEPCSARLSTPHSVIHKPCITLRIIPYPQRLLSNSVYI